MNNNKFICFIPMIAIWLYFIPPVGMCLLLVKYFVYSTNTRKTPITLISLGLILLSSKVILYICNFANFDTGKIPYLNYIIESNFYNDKIINYCKILITSGIIFEILNFFFNKLVEVVKKHLKNREERDYKIDKENNLKMKEKREKARNTHFVTCPYCGANNIVVGKIGKCKYCRRIIETKK